MALAPGKEAYHQRTSTGVPGRRHLIFYFYHGQSLFLDSVPLSLLIKADVQVMFDRPQAVRSS